MYSKIILIAWLAVIFGAGLLVGRRFGPKRQGSLKRDRNSPETGHSEKAQ